MTDVIEIIKTANLSQLIRTTYDYQLVQAVRERLVQSLEAHCSKEPERGVLGSKAILYDT